MLLKYILIILIITICIVSIIHKKTISSSFRNINSIAYDQTVFLLNVSNYTQWAINFNNYIPEALIVYINNSIDPTKFVNWQQSLGQCYVDIYYQYYNIKYTPSTLPPLTKAFMQSFSSQPTTILWDDFANNILPLVMNFTPDVPSSITFYSYKQADISNTFYIKNSTRVNTLKNCVDLAISLNGQFYVNKNVINVLTDTDKNKNDYIKAITDTKINYFISPVKYTFFDPLDLYLHPKRYTLNMGVGIMDNTQPNYTLFVEKNQLKSLNRLLTLSSIDTPMIHAFFDLPNYTVEWDNSWKNVMFNDYDTYINKNYSTTDAFQKTLENIFLMKNGDGIDIKFDYTKASSYFDIIPSSFYWIILLLSLFNPAFSNDQNKLLLQRLVNAGYDPTECYNNCDSEMKVCDNEAKVITDACYFSCGDINSNPCQDNCNSGFTLLQQECGIDNKICKTQCLSNDSLPSMCLSNSDCPNKACGRITAAQYEPDVCCPSGKIDDFFANDYCTDMNDGSTCWTDAMCKSDYCDGSDWIIRVKGKCSTLS